MKYDVELCKSLGVEGVVFGILNPDGTVDKDRTKKLVDAAMPMNVTFHRAFDMTKDPFAALEDIIEIGGIQRILTSGQESSAYEGLDLIYLLVSKASGRILIMPGAGIHERNIKKFIENIPTLTEIHVWADSKEEGRMQYKNHNVFMGFGLFSPEYTLSISNENRIKNLVNSISK